MMEKEQHDSMATVQMSKADYAASEVYSTTSEPPPAYRRETSSVRIAKIIGLTVVVSSFILGAFILASSYLQARASCDQMQTLDSILEKELMLETLQELPKAEALLSGRDLPSDNDVQSLDNNKNDKENANNASKGKNIGSDSDDSSSSSSDNSFSESDEAEELNRVQIKMPLELSLSDLANAILQQNQKSRMNCVIERRRAEELVDNIPKMTPFGFNFNAEPKKRVTGERMAIFCESGTAIKDDNDDDSEPRQIPIQRLPIPFGAMPEQYPLTHMPQQQMQSQPMMPAVAQQQSSIPPQLPFIIRQIVALQQQAQQQQPQPQQPIMIRPAMVSQYPIPEPQQHQQPPPPPPPQQQQQPGEIRIHLQRLPISRDEIQVREIPIEVREIPIQARPNMIRPIQSIRLQSVEREQQPNFLRESFGLTNEDLMNIQRLAQERIEQELRSLAQDDSESSSSENSQDDDVKKSEEEVNFKEDNDKMDSSKIQNKEDENVENDAQSAEPDTQTDADVDKDDSQILQVGRAAYGRSIITPVNIPVDMMQKQEQSPSVENRPHFVQPRSVRDE